jgi:hypothetical protein
VNVGAQEWTASARRGQVRLTSRPCCASLITHDKRATNTYANPYDSIATVFPPSWTGLSLARPTGMLLLDQMAACPRNLVLVRARQAHMHTLKILRHREVDFCTHWVGIFPGAALKLCA